jgi:spore germination protein KA
MSAVLECIVLVIMFEILKQAGLRMPQSVGQALGIVGGLVVGQAAVEARIISAPMLIAVSFGSIAGLVVPQLQGVVFYVRLLSVVVAAFLGVFGLILLYFLLCIRLFSINSFGADYTEGIGEATFQSLKDTIIRASWRDMIKRPIFNRNIIRNGGYRRW